MKKKTDDWRATSVFLRSDASLATSAPTQTKKETLLVDLHEAASILGIPVTAVRRLIAEDKLPATRAGRGGKFMIARTAIVKYSERIK